MFITFLKESKWAMGIFFIARLFLGWTWLTAGIGKLREGFDAGGFLQNAVANPVIDDGGNAAYPLYTAFLENVVLPNASLFSAFVMWGQILVGLGLIVGLLTTTATFFSGTMNLAFLLAGAVSTNPLMLMIAIFIMIGKGNAGAIGLDRFVPVVMDNVKGRREIRSISHGQKETST
ncbi:DoxX family membrane protein [Natribacillus halophilus]|uniref:Thiosulfate dehydrogenase [quinone] large subunit n=1 Tax=Natribacillus halophilus TaxID=549003 RepID=A0A1G8N210_9BACI|nr:DoxX family membrane protein [Natribacillus halophilus]SDI74289.1 thiosulfate dehydrogenase [quinone] large subunit [Natribacillus halophilus]